MTKWIAIIAGAIIALYLIVVGIKSACFGSSKETLPDIKPEDVTITIE